MHAIRGVADRTRAVIALTRASGVSLLAASTAYYAFVSLFPLLLLTVAVGSLLGGEVLADRLVAVVADALSPSGRALLRDALSTGAGRGEATVVGFVGLLWSGLRVFRGIDLAFAAVYGTATRPTLPEQVRDAVVVLAVLGLGALAVVAGTAVVAQSGVALSGLTRSLAIAVALATVLLPLYAVFPDVAVGLREALPGAVVAGVGWTLLSLTFGFYAATAGQFDVYGVIGGVLLLLAWLYVGAAIVLVGAAVNAVLGGRDRQLQHAPRRTFGRYPTMTGSEDDDAGEGPTDGADADGEVAALRAEIERLEAEIDDRTVHRETIASDLRRYVRRRVRRGHAHGWGPYLVLAYGTAMTLGAFYFLGGGWAILAMLVIWLSTLGLYALMVVVGLTVTLAGAPGRALDRLRDWRF